jgi:hypothetical protein
MIFTVSMRTLELLRSDIEASARDAREAAEPRRRLRALVHRIDLLVAACERRHLERRSTVDAELAAEADGVLREIAEMLPGAGAGGDVPAHTDQLMDLLWTLQERVFDALTPWRRTLAEDEEPAARR